MRTRSSQVNYGRIVRFWQGDVPPEKVIIKWRDKTGKAWFMEYEPTEPKPDIEDFNDVYAT